MDRFSRKMGFYDISKASYETLPLDEKELF